MMIIGCDFHHSWQQVSCVDTETGECGERKLVHASGEAKMFYQQTGVHSASGAHPPPSRSMPLTEPSLLSRGTLPAHSIDEPRELLTYRSTTPSAHSIGVLLRTRKLASSYAGNNEGRESVAFPIIHVPQTPATPGRRSHGLSRVQLLESVS